jgi:hypothetical protein
MQEPQYMPCARFNVIGNHLAYPPRRAVSLKRGTDVKPKKTRKPKRKGDVLGLSDAPPDVEIPRATQDRGGHPEGVEVRGEPKRHWGNEDIPVGKGATGIDMGGGGTDTSIASDLPKPKVSEKV